MDSDMDGTWEHAMSGRKSVINWPAPALLLNTCTRGLQHVTVTNLQSISVNNVKGLTDTGSVSRILAADLAASVCSVSEQRQRPDAHHRPVRVHAQRPGKGLQAKRSESLCAQNSAIQKLDQNRNNMSYSLQLALCTKPYSASKMNIQQLWSQHLQSVGHNIPPISCRKLIGRNE